MQHPQNRLSNDNYKRPVNTKTDKLTGDDISDMLDDYKLVESFKDIKIGTHIRYFITDKNSGEKKFRPGGFLKAKNKIPEYIVLSNTQKSWSVQMGGATFFRKLTFDELKKETDDYIASLEIYIEQLEKQVESYGGTINRTIAK